MYQQIVAQTYSDGNPTTRFPYIGTRTHVNTMQLSDSFDDSRVTIQQCSPNNKRDPIPRILSLIRTPSSLSPLSLISFRVRVLRL